MQAPDLFSQPAPKVPGVSELTMLIKDLLEASFQDTQVEGEVSKPQQSSAGHVYFTLKDDKAQLPCVMWRSTVQRLGFRLAHGQLVTLTGDVQVYAPHGRYQFIVRSAKQAGLGALQQAFEQLKQKLQAEGLFHPSHKKKMPRLPRRIGIVTSAQGAALQDIISTFQKRYPLVTLMVHHAAVQGVQAAGEIVRGIEWFSTRGNVDILIITRGGGSLEDLWPFNEEAVARALFASPIPTVSAVGHETDFTIADFVADLRAATPTQAVALLVPDINDLRFTLDMQHEKLHRTITQRIDRLKNHVQALGRTHALHAVLDKLKRHHAQVAHLSSRSLSLTEMRLLKARSQYEKLNARLRELNPNIALEQGYTRIWQENTWVKQASAFETDKPFSIEWHDARVSR
ncbi:Exodeoxyribonuclease VII large subunit [Cyclonatronum proteinivorum]|uniref:Exodeoxyribonuclease 7 large subunit n=1 Tax=Cyclonatronum proteinivorum TaxID=1457365 RepID=A0A345UKH7_9BACT|nr:exodeoxyribonuclease VII large subunit [Cyclonatronum proteinivorum]AXJ00979.1 Exodeoxyribonuclease VII large subunit [Cyclonatronum proteinivorum]